MTAVDLAARRAAAASVLADYNRELHTAPLSRPPGREWMLRLANELESLLDALAAGPDGQAQTAAAAAPLETEAQTRQLPEVRAVYEAFDADPGVGKMAVHNRRMLGRACEAAGIVMGRYDDQIIAWLAGWEPATCAVVAGLIERAHAAGRAAQAIDTDLLRGAVLAGNYDLGDDEVATVLDALEVAAEYRRYRASLTCEACNAAPDEVCDDHAADAQRADEYDQLAVQIREATR